MPFKPVSFDSIVTTVQAIDSMPNLSARLGKAKVDRIRIHGLGEPTEASSRTRTVVNLHRQFMLEIPAHSGGPVDDIVAGVAALEIVGAKCLSASRLHNLLQSMDTLSSESIMAGLKVDKRQAQRYLAAAKLCIKHISNHRNKPCQTE